MNGTYIDVTGKAEEYIKPDTLTFNISINEEGKDTAEATKKVSEKADKAIKILTDNGIKKEDIKLLYYSIVDKYSQEVVTCDHPSVQPNIATTDKVIIPPCYGTESKIIGQTIYQTMEVRIRDIDTNADNDKRSKIISDLAKENIKADGFTFTVYDIDSVKKQIREKAIDNAKLDAKKIAKELDLDIVEITGFYDNASMGRYSEGGYSAKAVSADATMLSSAVPAPELTPGQQKVTANITLTYLMR